MLTLYYCIWYKRNNQENEFIKRKISYNIVSWVWYQNRYFGARVALE